MPIKTEYKEFIKSRALKGYSSIRIKKELWWKYGKKSVSIVTIRIMAARFRAIAGLSIQKNISRKPGNKIIEEKYRNFIENCVNRTKSLAEVEEELWTEYGKMSVSRTAIKKWFYFYRFKNVADEVLKSTPSNHQTTTMTQNTASNELEINPRGSFGEDLKIERLLGDVVINDVRIITLEFF